MQSLVAPMINDAKLNWLSWFRCNVPPRAAAHQRVADPFGGRAKERAGEKPALKRDQPTAKVLTTELAEPYQ